MIQKHTHCQRACWRPPTVGNRATSPNYCPLTAIFQHLLPSPCSLEHELPDAQEQIGAANKTNVIEHVVKSLAHKPPRRCGASRWSAMNTPLLSGYVDEIVFASRSLHQSMFWDEAAASISKASLTDVVIARLAKVAVKMDFYCYFTTFIAVHSMVEVDT